MIYFFNGYIMTNIDSDKDLNTGDKTMLFWSGLNNGSPTQDGIMQRFGNAGVKFDVNDVGAVVPTDTVTGILEFILKLIQNPVISAIWSNYIKGIFTWFFNPGRNNWCCCQVGDIIGDSICFTSYSYKDFLQWKSYRTHYVKAGDEAMVNAGNGPKNPFKISVWCKSGKMIKKWQLLKTICVFYRDVIRVSKGTSGDLVVVHCKGEYHAAQGGDVELY